MQQITPGLSLSPDQLTNVDLDPLPNPGDEISFSKSWTAFIPESLELLVILARLADVFSMVRKHIMHLAVLFGLFGFFVRLERLAVRLQEMNW